MNKLDENLVEVLEVIKKDGYVPTSPYNQTMGYYDPNIQTYIYDCTHKLCELVDRTFKNIRLYEIYQSTHLSQYALQLYLQFNDGNHITIIFRVSEFTSDDALLYYLRNRSNKALSELILKRYFK